MPLMMKDALKWPDLSTGKGYRYPKIRHLQPPRLRSRYLRRNRIQYTVRKPNHVRLPLSHIWLSASVDRKLRQLAVLDDRSLAELVALGVTWVVTYYAAAALQLSDAELHERLENVKRFDRRRRNPFHDPLTTIKMVEEGGEGAWRMLLK
jgi:hypothetical protein